MQNYIKPIQLGSLKLQSNIVQGPLAGYSCAPFRVLAWRYGQPGFCTTEMISAHDLVHRREKPKRFLYRDPEEKILSYQLSGNDPLMLAKATEIVTKEGADIIDLNCGCPVNKIRRKNCGSKLLTTPEQLYQLIRAIKQNTDAVVSIKIRVASPVHDHDEALIIDAATKAGVDFITVHGRHWTERYDKLCQIEAIARIVKMTNLPIFANGDVADIDSLNHIFEKTNCAGVMIARASVGQPWLFQKLYSESNKKTFEEPEVEHVGKIFLEHIEQLQSFENEKLAVLQSRKLAKYYARKIKDPINFVSEIQSAKNIKTIADLTKKYFSQNPT